MPGQVSDFQKTCFDDPSNCGIPKENKAPVKVVEGSEAETVFHALDNDFVIGPHFDSDGGETYIVARKSKKVTCMRVIRWSKAGEHEHSPDLNYRCQGEFR